MLNAPETDIALRVVESLADGKLAVGRLGAVYRPTRKQGGQLRYGESEELIREDVVQSFLAVRDLFLQPLVEALGNLAEKDAGLAPRVKKPGIPVAPDFLG